MGGIVASKTTGAPAPASSTGASAPGQPAYSSGIIGAFAGFFALLLLWCSIRVSYDILIWNLERIEQEGVDHHPITYPPFFIACIYLMYT